MRNVLRAILCVAILCLVYSFAPAQKERSKIEILAPKSYRPPPLASSAELETMLKEAVGVVLDPANGKAFKSDEIAATLIDLRDPQNLKWANVAGEKPIYPASVVKMFYMAALERQLEDGKIKMSPELERGLRDMIVVSSNEATQYILDVVTGTSSGAELPDKEFIAWQEKRNRVNRSKRGATDIPGVLADTDVRFLRREPVAMDRTFGCTANGVDELQIGQPGFLVQEVFGRQIA